MNPLYIFLVKSSDFEIDRWLYRDMNYLNEARAATVAQLAALDVTAHDLSQPQDVRIKANQDIIAFGGVLREIDKAIATVGQRTGWTFQTIEGQFRLYWQYCQRWFRERYHFDTALDIETLNTGKPYDYICTWGTTVAPTHWSLPELSARRAGGGNVEENQLWGLVDLRLIERGIMVNKHPGGWDVNWVPRAPDGREIGIKVAVVLNGDGSGGGAHDPFDFNNHHPEYRYGGRSYMGAEAEFRQWVTGLTDFGLLASDTGAYDKAAHCEFALHETYGHDTGQLCHLGNITGYYLPVGAIDPANGLPSVDGKKDWTDIVDTVIGVPIMPGQIDEVRHASQYHVEEIPPIEPINVATQDLTVAYECMWVTPRGFEVRVFLDGMQLATLKTPTGIYTFPGAGLARIELWEFVGLHNLDSKFGEWSGRVTAPVGVPEPPPTNPLVVAPMTVQIGLLTNRSAVISSNKEAMFSITGRAATLEQTSSRTATVHASRKGSATVTVRAGSEAAYVAVTVKRW